MGGRITLLYAKLLEREMLGIPELIIRERKMHLTSHVFVILLIVEMEREIWNATLLLLETQKGPRWDSLDFLLACFPQLLIDSVHAIVISHSRFCNHLQLTRQMRDMYAFQVARKPLCFGTFRVCYL